MFLACANVCISLCLIFGPCRLVMVPFTWRMFLIPLLHDTGYLLLSHPATDFMWSCIPKPLRLGSNLTQRRSLLPYPLTFIVLAIIIASSMLKLHLSDLEQICDHTWTQDNSAICKWQVEISQLIAEVATQRYSVHRKLQLPNKGSLKFYPETTFFPTNPIMINGKN